MQIKGNNIQQARLTIRVSRNTLSFSVVDREAEHQLIYEPYTVKSGVSMAANLRQAFKESTLLQRGRGTGEWRHADDCEEQLLLDGGRKKEKKGKGRKKSEE